MEVRVFSEHRCEAAAPTEPAGETQRPPVADHSRPKEVPLGYGEIPWLKSLGKGWIQKQFGGLFLKRSGNHDRINKLLFPDRLNL